jgi:4-hydroxybenzoyl-CoA reductase subunit beta
MALPAFELLRPATLTDALAELAPSAVDVRPLSGGTDLLVAMKEGRITPVRVVDMSGLPELKQVRIGDDHVFAGAGVTVAEIADSAEIASALPALSEAAGVLASPLLRNSGTIGGNLCLPPRCLYLNRSNFWRQSVGACLRTGGSVCHAAPRSKRCLASFAADLPPALIALGARVRTALWEGTGVLEDERPMEQLYRDDGVAWLRLRAGEVVIGVLVPRVKGLRSGYVKFRRRGSIDFPLAGVAVALRVEDGVMRDVRVVVGALASAPLRATVSETLLEGRTPELAVLAEAAAAVAQGTRPAHNQGDTPAHRREMARVMCGRLLSRLTSSMS